jgi:NAD(P)-dependent dehydrogenase (short-subunit alcohol dehydrogenase family)
MQDLTGVKLTQSKWSEEEIPEQSGRTAVVTGASSGIGFETARALAARGAHVVLAVRSSERGHAAVSRILAERPRASLDVLALDLADLASVHRFADLFRARFDTLALLVNNAGVSSPLLMHTRDGFELLFGTNYLGHFALTGLLLPAILATPQARLITVTSLTHFIGRIEFDNLDASKGYSLIRAYSQSKLAGLLFAYELQRRFSAAGSDVISVACHPGWAVTNMTAGLVAPDTGPIYQLFGLLTKFLAHAPHAGSGPTLYAATSPYVKGGDYVGPSGLLGVWGPPGRVSSSFRSHDQELARQLWEVSEKMTGVRYDDYR